ncbi:MAG: hypothetical protein Q9211_001150 [Gyalolechia sp. 1 TL-2023]
MYSPRPHGSIEPLVVSIQETWKKCRGKGDNFKKDLPEEVMSYLYIKIKQTLEAAIEGEPEHLENLVSGIKDFLEDEKKQHQIDDCIRWLILFKAMDCAPEVGEEAVVREAAEESIDSEKDANILITRIIIEIAPDLAFDNPYRPSKKALPWKPENIKRRCKYPNVHEKHKATNLKSTPFHRAASNGNGKAVKHMIYRGSLFPPAGSDKPVQHESLLQVLRLPDPDPHSEKTALWLAAGAEAEAPGALKALLKYDAIGITVPSDGTFENALRRGSTNIVNAFLQSEGLGKLIIKSEHIIEGINTLSKAGSDARENQANIVNTLVSCATTGEVINDHVIDRIIQLDLKEVWEKKSPEITLDTSRLLHAAVQHQNAGFVEMFLRDYPNSITEKKDNHYPLWHNNQISTASEDGDGKSTKWSKKDEIRNMIVTATIRHKKIDKMQDLLQIFEDSDLSELCFDLSRFSSEAYPVSDFVRSLIAHQDYAGLLSYEHTIRYAEFPALDLKADEKETFGDSVHIEHTEIFEALNWLNQKKNVKEIIELIVPDRLVNPHDEVGIGRHVKDFKVEVLNWRYLDMSISIFDDEETRKRIRKLHLYSSGKRAAISHWLSEEGVVSLPNELMTKEHCRTNVGFIRAKFDEKSKEINEGRKRENREGLRVRVNPQPWNPTHETVADLEEIAERAVPKLSRFIKSYHKHVHDIVNPDTFRPTKVAIIDNGILTISPRAKGPQSVLHRSGGPEDGSRSGDELRISNDARESKSLWSRIKGGRSFVDDNFRVSPWLFASDPHGTQMANLICAIDPCCELYVAKVAETRSGITPERVAKAVRWAISEHVDIISMSFAIFETIDDCLLNACAEAANAGIVMLCSAHDEGFNVKEAWPASYGDTLTIAACDRFGELLRPTTQVIEYALRAKEVAAGVVPFLKSDDLISGSSVATAIAAGLSSLILSCDRLAHPEKTYTGRKDREKVIRHHLDGMKMLERGSYILLEKFANIGQKIKDGRDIEAVQVLKSFF